MGKARAVSCYDIDHKSSEKPHQDSAYWEAEAKKAFAERDKLKQKLREACPSIEAEEWKKQFMHDIKWYDTYVDEKGMIKFDKLLDLIEYYESQNKYIVRIDAPCEFLKALRNIVSSNFDVSSKYHYLQSGKLASLCISAYPSIEIFLCNQLGVMIRLYTENIGYTEYDFPAQKDAFIVKPDTDPMLKEALKNNGISSPIIHSDGTPITSYEAGWNAACSARVGDNYRNRTNPFTHNSENAHRWQEGWDDFVNENSHLIAKPKTPKEIQLITWNMPIGVVAVIGAGKRLVLEIDSQTGKEKDITFDLAPNIVFDYGGKDLSFMDDMNILKKVERCVPLFEITSELCDTEKEARENAENKLQEKLKELRDEKCHTILVCKKTDLVVGAATVHMKGGVDKYVAWMEIGIAGWNKTL